MQNESSKQLDTAVEIVTPENIAFTYLLAGPFRRINAFLCDCFIIVGILMLSGLFFLLLRFYLPIPGGYIVGFQLVLAFVLSWFYGAFFESIWNGQTPGKIASGLRVLTVEGEPINAFQAFLRNVLRLADLQPGMFGLVGLGVSALNDRFQRLGDIAAGTMVVVEETAVVRRDLTKFDHPDVLKMAEKISTAFYVTPGMTKALALYAHRRKFLSLRRREEIAQRLALPLLERYGFPLNTNPDLFLCAVYHAIFAESLEDPLAEKAETVRREIPAFKIPEQLPPMFIEQ